ncbi:MAG: ATP-binding protein, partial [Lentisphaeria bacterium]|nr:ATP-binding protein [Lentisphaeria bacterium]
MKEIRIFIASSQELLPERNYLSYLTLVHEEEFEKRGLAVRLSKWEYVDPRMTGERTEDRYLDEMLQCDAVMILFKNILGKYTEEEMTKAIAAERAGTTRLKAHEILFAADGEPDSDAAGYRSSLPDGDYDTWLGPEELRDRFLALVDRVAQCENLVEAPGNLRKITAFLAADDELAAERDAFADTVLNINDLLARRGLRIALRFYDPDRAAGVLDSSEMGLALYGTNCRVFGREEIKQIRERLDDRSRNPKCFYVFFRDLDPNTEKALDETFRTFRNDFVTKLEHFPCQFGDANALRVSFLLSLERYAGEGIEIYSTVDASSPAFVGREEELKRLRALFEPDREKYPCGRIPVITGAGGTGKSELVRQYASQLRVEFPGGVFQADMEHVETVDEAFLRLLDRTSNNGVKVADCLGLGEGNVRGNGPENSKTSGRLSGADVRDAILRRAGTSGPVLLFLDNVE